MGTDQCSGSTTIAGLIETALQILRQQDGNINSETAPKTYKFCLDIGVSGEEVEGQGSTSLRWRVRVPTSRSATASSSTVHRYLHITPLGLVFIHFCYIEP